MYFRTIIENLLGDDDVWIGLNDIHAEGSFVWVNGAPWRADDFQWGRNGQPDNGHGSNEDCVHFNVENYVDDELNDFPCRFSKFGLCEKPVQV